MRITASAGDTPEVRREYAECAPEIRRKTAGKESISEPSKRPKAELRDGVFSLTSFEADLSSHVISAVAQPKRSLPYFKLRQADEPCRWCGASYLLLNRNQKWHSQQPDCHKSEKNARASVARRAKSRYPDFVPHLAGAPCRWCGERYMLKDARQKYHAQSAWCLDQQNRETLRVLHEKRRQKAAGESGRWCRKS